MQYNKQSINSSFPKHLLLILGIFTLAACGSLHPVSNTAELTKSSANHSIRGLVIENDGATPVYGATVSILSAESQNLTDGQNPPADVINLSKVEEGNASNPVCTSPSQMHIAYTCTTEDGSFTLDLSKVHEFPVVMRIDGLHQSTEIALTAKDLDSDLGMITLDSETAETKEKVAVVMDFYNPLDDIQEFLNENPSQTHEVKLQLMQEYQSLYQIGSDESDIKYPTFFSLFNDADEDGKPDIFNYDVVYINSRQKSDIALLDQSIRKELLNFISNGGNLFITEWSVQLEAEEPTPDQYI